MFNVTYDVKTKKGNIGFTVIPAESKVSSTGKSNVVKTTSGFRPIEGTDMRISITIIGPVKE